MYSKFSDFSLDIVRLINSSGGEARFVGGCVRDALLGRKFQDIDVASTLRPEALVELLKEHNVRYITNGIEHGTVGAILGNEKVEVTTLREDVACDGRHAEVRFTDNWEADASRRDFTMNAVYIDIDGKIFDYFDGINDMEAGRIHFIGNPEARIEEDYLRILRLFRFHAHYGKHELYGKDVAACSKHLEGLKNVSAERISQEFLKILAAPMPIYSLVTAEKAGILQKILPMSEYAIDELHEMLRIKKEAHYLLKFACLLSKLTNPVNDVSLLSEYWRMSNNEKNYLLSVLSPAIAVHFSMTEKQQQKAIRILGKESYLDILYLEYAKQGVGYAAKMKEMEQFASSWVVPKLPVKGVDLLKLGLKEGQEIGKILREAEEYWESKNYNVTQEQILAYLNIRVLTEDASA